MYSWHTTRKGGTQAAWPIADGAGKRISQTAAPHTTSKAGRLGLGAGAAGARWRPCMQARAGAPVRSRLTPCIVRQAQSAKHAGTRPISAGIPKIRPSGPGSL